MQELKIEMQSDSKGAFVIYDSGIKAGEMIFGINDNELTAVHTEVNPNFEGKGFAKMLFNQMVEYVSVNNMMVIPLCPYVLAQFKKERELYRDIWKKETVKF
ncbi:MAG TPA: GNAT family N-acetyltransferase [Flavobacterium sp.]|jgi:hypothetical protein